MSRAMKAVALLIGLFVLIPAALFAQDFKSPEVPPGVAIGGYSPVSYFEHNRAERGSPQFSAEHEGKTYWFVSAEQKAKFEADPRAFEPAFNAFCPFSLALGRKVAIDPTRFKIVEGKLLLFHNSAELDALEQWNLRGDEHWLDRTPSGEFMIKRF